MQTAYNYYSYQAHIISPCSKTETQITVFHCLCKGVAKHVVGFHSASVCLAPNEHIWVELREFPNHCTQSLGSVLCVEDGWEIIWALTVNSKRDNCRKHTVHSDAGELPRRKHTTFRTRWKFEIKNTVHVCRYRRAVIWVKNIYCFHNCSIYYLRITQTEKRDHQQSMCESHKTA